MKCSRVRDKLMDYASADLSQGDIQRMNEHLMRCDECRKELELARGASSALSMLAGEEPSPALVGAVREKLSRRSRPVLFPRLAMGFSATALIALIVTGWLRYGSVDQKNVVAVNPRTGQTQQNESFDGAKTSPPSTVHANEPSQLLVSDQPASKQARPRVRRIERTVPATNMAGRERAPFIAPEADSEPVMFFAMQPKEPEIYVTHLDAEEGESATELTVVREFDEGGNISSVTIEGTPSAGSSGDVVPASDRTHLLDVPPTTNLEARNPDAGGITRHA